MKMNCVYGCVQVLILSCVQQDVKDKKERTDIHIICVTKYRYQSNVFKIEEKPRNNITQKYVINILKK